MPLVGCPGENALASAKTISYLSAGNLRENSNYNQNDQYFRAEWGFGVLGFWGFGVKSSVMECGNTGSSYGLCDN